MTEPDMQALKAHSIRGAAATLAAQALRFVLQLASQIALARLLLPADFGLVAMAAPLLAFVQIFNELGLSQATIQRPDITQGELSALFWTNAAISAALAAGFAACAPLVGLFYGQPRIVPICVALGGLLVLSGLSAQQIALMNRHMRFRNLAVIDVACNAAAVAVGIAAAWRGCGAWSLVFMQAANSLTLLTLAWTLSGWRPSRPAREAGLRSLLAFGGHVTGFNLVNFVCNNLDPVLLGRFGGSIALGFYDRGLRLVATPFWQISLPVARVAVTLLSRLQADPARYRAAFSHMLQALLLALVPLLVWIACAARGVVPLLFGQRWAEVSPIVSWLAVATLVSPFSLASNWLFISQGRASQQVAYAGLKTAVSLLAIVLGLRWGAVGVARSLALFALPIHGALLWGATRSGHVRLPAVLQSCRPVLAGGLAAWAALALLPLPVGAGTWITVLAGGAGLTLSYAACATVFLCFPGGRDLARQAVPGWVRHKAGHLFTGNARRLLRSSGG